MITNRSHSIPEVKPEWLHRRNNYAVPWGRFLPGVIQGRLLYNEWTSSPTLSQHLSDTTVTFMHFFFFYNTPVWAQLNKVVCFLTLTTTTKLFVNSVHWFVGALMCFLCLSVSLFGVLFIVCFCSSGLFTLCLLYVLETFFFVFGNLSIMVQP